jgi:hypothetical protein
MHFEAAWHAQGLRWIAAVLQDVAGFLERTGHEPAAPGHEPDIVEKARLRAHLRGF